MTDLKALDLLRQILALSRTGVHFTGEQYRSDHNRLFDRDRFEEIGALATQLIASQSKLSAEPMLAAWHADDGYVTPKVDVRGAVFRDNEVLLVREISDGKWTLPGGWADVNETPTQAVEKEILQESGFVAKVAKLAALHDRRIRNRPASLFYIWKLFFICDIVSGEPRVSNETDGVDFFTLDALPPLSEGRTVAEQIHCAYKHHLNRSLATEFD
jgi:ADP-ribose pyrophosphatase YjhB (NUDIX family)